MDEEVSLRCPWPEETIPLNDFLSRHFHAASLHGEKTRRFPSDAHFDLHFGEDGLSNYWNRHISLEDIFITIGLSHNKNGSFKEFESFKIFQIENRFIQELNDAIIVSHNPAFYGNPSPVGQPNNRSHSLIKFSSLDEEDFLQIRINLSDYCRINHSTSYRKFDVKKIRDKIQILRDLGNDTPYHKISLESEFQ